MTTREQRAEWKRIKDWYDTESNILDLLDGEIADAECVLINDAFPALLKDVEELEAERDALREALKRKTSNHLDVEQYFDDGGSDALEETKK